MPCVCRLKCYNHHLMSPRESELAKKQRTTYNHIPGLHRQNTFEKHRQIMMGVLIGIYSIIDGMPATNMLITTTQVRAWTSNCASYILWLKLFIYTPSSMFAFFVAKEIREFVKRREVVIGEIIYGIGVIGRKDYHASNSGRHVRGILAAEPYKSGPPKINIYRT